VPAATALVATACLVTAILVPILTAMWAKHANPGKDFADFDPAELDRTEAAE
jgi:2-keto-3-deoxygluconate permease